MSHSPKPSATYNISRGATDTEIDIEIHAPVLRAENLSLTTWGSSYVLANVLHDIKLDNQTFWNDGIAVLELGAGTGLAGLSASVIWKRNAILTDLKGIVPGLAKNINANQELLASVGTSVICGSLDWKNPSRLILHGGNAMGSKFGVDSCSLSASRQTDVILAADTIYDSEHPEMIVNTILAWLRPGEHSRAVIAYPLRVAYLDAIRETWDRLEAVGLTSIQEGRVDAGDDFEDERLIDWAVFKWKNP